MAIDEKTLEALDLSTLTLPPNPPVSRIEPQEYTDSTGEPSLRVLVVLGENTDVTKISGEDVGELKAAIRQSLLDRGIVKFPYIFISTPEELADQDEEEE